MNKYEVSMGFQKLREARESWNAGRFLFNKEYDRVLRRLIHEGARAFMSEVDMRQELGVSGKVMRLAMRRAGLDPRSGKRNLSDAASKALVGNAELLGVDPNAFDLTSPLAYLPAGDRLRQQLTPVSKVTDLPEDTVTVNIEDLRKVLAAADYIGDRSLIGPVDRLSDIVALATMKSQA